jgi:hypothetical protein
MKRVPVCFGDYVQRDKMCNGRNGVAPCLVRDRCSAFRGLLEEGNEKREELIKINRTHAYADHELINRLDRRVAHLGIRDGLVRLARKRQAPMNVNFTITANDLFEWFVQQLSKESRRAVVPRKGLAEVGQIFFDYNPSGAGEYQVYCRMTEMECAPIASVRLQKRFSRIHVTVPRADFQETFSKKERTALEVEGSEVSTCFKSLDRYQASVVALRVARAINGGRMAMPFEVT